MNDTRTSKELVKSLRDYSEGPTFYWGPICQKAAEEIERLQRELAASAAQYQEACDDANRFARERDEARASPEPGTVPARVFDLTHELRSYFDSGLSAKDTDLYLLLKEIEEMRSAQPPGALTVAKMESTLGDSPIHICVDNKWHLGKLATCSSCSAATKGGEL